MTTTLSFGQTLKDLRRQKRLTQTELVELLKKREVEVDVTYISKIENDRLDRPPSKSLIRSLCQALGANADEMLDLAGKFDARALQKKVSEWPETGVLLRRLQKGQISRAQIQRLLKSTDKDKDAD